MTQLALPLDCGNDLVDSWSDQAGLDVADCYFLRVTTRMQRFLSLLLVLGLFAGSSSAGVPSLTFLVVGNMGGTNVAPFTTPAQIEVANQMSALPFPQSPLP